MINRIINKLDWIWDYYFVYFLYNGNKMDRYYEYMNKKWNKNGK